jgi:flavin-dependent dehydrogenase
MRDVAIIGGGPGGSTLSALLKKYRPDMDVVVLEREKFPREHVGESQLPPIGAILDEMGCWDKVEAANFPIKIGATYRWGNTRDLWDFELYPASKFRDEPRPAQFTGQRTSTAFQVERSVYDKILLDHAASIGVEVREETKVAEILRDGDRVEGLRLESGEVIQARHYVDASGSSGLLRRAMGVGIVEPSSLRNIAFWDYWNNTEWAFSVGTGGTRVLVMSLGYGWIWFIPIGPTRTSIGLVCPADYYLQTGLSKEEVYLKAIQDEPLISGLTAAATRDDEVRATKDWSYFAERMHGENWFLVGEAAGFADPILAAGLTMTHVGAQELAYTILELENGRHDPAWLKQQMDENQTRRVRQHIQFADFWYTANGCFTDVKEHTRTIAAKAGLDLDANKAFQWLGTGGFLQEQTEAGFSGYDFIGVKDTVELLTQEKTELLVHQFNRFELDLAGAVEEEFAVYNKGEVGSLRRWRRGDQTLPKTGFAYVLAQIIQRRGDLPFVVSQMIMAVRQKGIRNTDEEALLYGLGYLEGMLQAGWVKGAHDPSLSMLKYELPSLTHGIKLNKDTFVLEGA